MKGKLYLVRHGESMGNVWSEAYRTDEKNFLSPYGVLQAQVAGAYLRKLDLNFNTVISSNLTRARHTMAILLHELDDWKREWIVEPDLNELHHHRLVEEGQRVAAAMDRVMNNWQTGDLLVVSHYHVMRAIFEWTKVHPAHIDSHEGRHIGNASIWQWKPGSDRIRLLDTTDTGFQH